RRNAPPWRLPAGANAWKPSPPPRPERPFASGSSPTRMTIATTSAPVDRSRNSYVLSITIIGGLFFLFGFVTWLNGALIPFLQLACELTTQQALLVTFAFYISYFVLARSEERRVGKECRARRSQCA